MKKIMFLVLFISLSVFTLQVSAQRSHYRASLESVVTLTEAQQTEVKKIKESYQSKFEALRQGEKTETNRTAMQQLMKEQQAAIAAVLTPEQRTKWEAHQTAQKAKMEQHRADREANHEKMKAARTEMQAYYEKNVKPVLQKQRAKLESKLSAADKKLIAELRTQHEQRRAEGFDHRGEKGRKMEGKHPKNDEKHAQVKALVEKYSAAIDALYAEIVTQENQWKQDEKAIWEKYAPAQSDKKVDKPARHRGEMGKNDGDLHKKVHFLLLNPNATSTTTKPAPINRKVEAFPNPAGATQNLEFEVLQAGKVTVEIIDNQGNVVKSVFNGNLELGMNKLQVTTGDLKGKSYFYRITDAKGTTTKAFIIQ